jgi:L-threonylcarbamoyladenylate synthase
MTDELESDIERAVAAVRLGNVVGIPTDTVYGIAADPRQRGAAERVFAAKRRPESLALPVLVADVSEVAGLARVDEVARSIIERFWPGPLTLVLPRRAGATLWLGGDGTSVGVRCPDHSVARALLRRTGPLAVTSANRHGDPPATTAAALRFALGAVVEVIVDGGTCDGSPSTVLSLVEGEPRVLREGTLPASLVLGEAAEAE